MIKLNTKGDVVRVMPLGDFHFGHQACDYNLIAESIDKAIDHDCYIVGTGDYVDFGAVDRSPGLSRYEQDLDSNESLIVLLEYLEPIKDRILFLTSGHHERRVTRLTGIDVIQWIGQHLKVPTYMYTAFEKFKVGKCTYDVVTKHGETGSTTLSGKINAAMKLGLIYDADVYLYGHTHELLAIPNVRYYYKGHDIKTKYVWFVLTGHALDYWETYAMQKEYIIGRKGYPIIEFGKKEKDVRVVIK